MTSKIYEVQAHTQSRTLPVKLSKWLVATVDLLKLLLALATCTSITDIVTACLAMPACSVHQTTVTFILGFVPYCLVLVGAVIALVLLAAADVANCEFAGFALI